MRIPFGVKLALTAAVIAAVIIGLSIRRASIPSVVIDPGETEGDRLVLTVNGIQFPFRWVPAGNYLMGSTAEEEGRDEAELRHPVELTRGFWILETEVTQAMYEAVTGKNPSEFRGKDLPVDTVSWYDAADFCKKWSEAARLTESSVSLPAEAEWEYACRAGTLGPYYGKLEEIAWTGEKTEEGATHSVAQKKPNDWGIYDMTGNLWEWTSDAWYDYSSEKMIDPKGPESEGAKIDRGGCWDSPPNESRSAYRGVYEPDRSSRFVGFRFVIHAG